MTNNTEIHPSAVVSSDAELAAGVKIGPFSTVGEMSLSDLIP